MEYLRDHLAKNHGPCFGCTSALGFCLEILLCFSAKQDRFCFKQHLHKPSLICALEKCIFEPKHHLVCEITKAQSCFSACVWIWVQQTQQLSAVPSHPGTHTGAVWALTPMDELRNEPPVLLDTTAR